MYSLKTKGRVEMTSFKVGIINSLKQFAFAALWGTNDNIFS